MPGPEIEIPEGASLLSDDSERAADTFANTDMLLGRIDTYIQQHDDPATAMQNMAVACAHLSGILYGRLDVLEIVKQPMDKLMVVVGHNFKSGFEAGSADMFHKLLCHAMQNCPRHKG
jgi:hypothetical protein